MEDWKIITAKYILAIGRRDIRMKISSDSPKKPNHVGLYFKAFLSILLASMENIDRGSRENFWNPKTPKIDT